MSASGEQIIRAGKENRSGREDQIELRGNERSQIEGGERRKIVKNEVWRGSRFEKYRSGERRVGCGREKNASER